jgi:hydrogenase maturation protein HypF
VQGVGFRPTVYKIANSLNLKGFVLNSGEGVIIEIEGDNSSKFLDELKKNLPPLARIDCIKEERLPLKNFKTFEIYYSKSSNKTTSISPDIAVCEKCLKEMFDVKNRRYLYPFINCTNCGPRYTIIKDIPYDRKNTSMSKFKMCKECEKEYNNPLDRRFHAEPISCYDCGPKLKVIDNEGKVLNVKNKIKFIADKIKEGKIVAVKGLGGFHLVCNATDFEVVKELRERKRRPFKPFAMMFKDIEKIKEFCDVDKRDIELITSKEKPIVLVKKEKRFKVYSG